MISSMILVSPGCYRMERFTMSDRRDKFRTLSNAKSWLSKHSRYTPGPTHSVYQLIFLKVSRGPYQFEYVFRKLVFCLI